MKVRPPRPTRSCRNRTLPRDSMRIAAATASISGEVRISPTDEVITSSVRLASRYGMGVGATAIAGTPSASMSRLVRLTSVTAGTRLLPVPRAGRGRGRGGRIRTGGLLLPKQVRYQAALRPGDRFTWAGAVAPSHASVMVIGAGTGVAGQAALAPPVSRIEELRLTR